MSAGKEGLALLQYAVVAVQGSAVAQANLAWLLQRSSAYDTQHKAELCMRLLTQAGKGGLADAWVDAGNMEYRVHQLGTPLCLWSATLLHAIICSVKWLHMGSLPCSRSNNRYTSSIFIGTSG